MGWLRSLYHDHHAIVQAASIEQLDNNNSFGEKAASSVEPTLTSIRKDISTHPQPQSIPDEPEPHQFLRKTKSAPNAHFLSREERRRRRYSNESLSSSSTPKTFRSRARGYKRKTVSFIARLNTVSNVRVVTGGKMPTLEKVLSKSMVPATSQDERFVPECVIEEVLSERAVLLALQKFDLKHDVSSLAEYICNHGRRLFAILLWSDLGHHIEKFKEMDFGDQNLPLHLIYNDEDIVEAFTFSFGNLSIIKEDNHPFNNGVWSQRVLETLCTTWQWPFLSPVFTKDQFRYQLHKKTIMPFMQEKPESRKETYFSVVEQWQIHREHIPKDRSIGLSASTDEHPWVAIKELKQTSMTEEELNTVAATETHTLELLRELNHTHLVKAIAYYTKGGKHFVMFPWAQGGNLRDFWKKDPPTLDPTYLEWVFSQLTGLAEAIMKLHNSHEEQHLRHGDLKPENILCFEDGNLTTLVITDLGLSKVHEKFTEARKAATRTKSGTIMYEPPESEILAEKPRSRRYDIWSIGCIYLEFVVWLLYGAKGLNRLRQELESSALNGNVRFYIIDTSHNTFQLNNVIKKWIEHIQNDRRCPEDTAVGQLIQLISTSLLVAVAPDHDTNNRRRDSVLSVRSTTYSGSPEEPNEFVLVTPATIRSGMTFGQDTGDRATAEDMFHEMKHILDSYSDDTKLDWMKWKESFQEAPGLYAKNLVAPDAIPIIGRNKEQEMNEYKFTPLDDNWEYTADTEIAQKVFADPVWTTGLSQTNEPPNLCKRCSDLQPWRLLFHFSDTLKSLRRKLEDCDLCRLLYLRVAERTPETDGRIRFIRVGSCLTHDDRRAQPLLSIFRLPAADSSLKLDTTSADVQLGFPILPVAGSKAHVQILSEWIGSCNQTHDCYPRNNVFLPSRVIDVGCQDSLIVRLLCDIRGQPRPGRYFALSHRWGTSAQHQSFCTYKRNIERYKDCIRIAELPKTFRDAIHVTRSLGCQYLWIDSLCIVQDDAEDWTTESARMEQVFSSAYVTIAASCAGNTEDGFLKIRTPRQCIPLSQRHDEQYFVCDAINDFDLDVDQGELNKRGWVLQERALSRRTIYFTEKQTYWECGGGVRCETLTKMRNRKASFLGDSNFPHSVDISGKGLKIMFYQNLYEKYSNLDLTVKSDRPIAIKGLEKRLIRVLDTVGGYGMLECFWHRCLLWQRSGDSLMRIQEFRDKSIPSWSWMAYHGGIKYMNIPFGEVSWNDGITSPFTRSDKYKDIHGADAVHSGIEAQAWEIVNAQHQLLILDESINVPDDELLKCVIIGKNKGLEPGPNQMHYVLIIHRVRGEKTKVYERIGVAFLERRYIHFHRPYFTVSIR